MGRIAFPSTWATAQSLSFEESMSCSDRLLAWILYNMFVAVQALRGEGFLHQGQLPTDLPKLPVYTGLATSSCQSGKATDMLPLTGRDPRLLEAVGEFQDAIHLAHQSG